MTSIKGSDEVNFISDFSFGEPSIKSTRKRNEDRKCCFYNYENLFPSAKDSYMGFLICGECEKKWKKIKEDIRRWQEYIDILSRFSNWGLE